MCSASGMTLAEMLVVVAILGVLCGVAFISVWRYQRSLGQLERDGIAKEIFVAAQNHLTAACGEGYRGKTSFGEPELDGDSSKTGVYYFVLNSSTRSSLMEENSESVFIDMLPFGSIDETVRGGGSYIVRYQKDTGRVLDVFYCSTNGTPSVFNHELNSEEYSDVLALAGAEKRMDRRTYSGGDNAILGWYGGAEAESLPKHTLANPALKVVNGERLYVSVTDPNYNETDESGVKLAGLSLVVVGKSSGAKSVVPLSLTSGNRVRLDIITKTYTVVLDDITESGYHFSELTADAGSFIPGENIEVYAIAYSNQVLANLAYSAKVTTNSLFGGISDSDGDRMMDQADIDNIRHLENLDPNVSNLSRCLSAGEAGEAERFNVTHAIQTSDLNWHTFKAGIGNDNIAVTYSEASGDGYAVNKRTDNGCFYPVEPDYALTYDGRNHSVSSIVERNVADGGMFGMISTVSTIQNIELVDFNISGSNTAGALAGSAFGCSVRNVLARTSTGQANVNIDAPVAGGLIGALSNDGFDRVEYNAAALVVHGADTAGGLIGFVSDSSSVICCFSGGHTQEGSYNQWVDENGYDISGGVAGGLAGNSGSAVIENCYSTCSVSGTVLAGGLVGSVEGGSRVENCYATGLIDTAYPNSCAFIGEGMPRLMSRNYYYSAVNPIEADGSEDPEFMEPVHWTADSDQIVPLDLNADTYNEFAGAWDTWHIAKVYDADLIGFYGGKYPFKTIAELEPELPEYIADWNMLFVNAHYGDWPALDIQFVNTL